MQFYVELNRNISILLIWNTDLKPKDNDQVIQLPL